MCPPTKSDTTPFFEADGEAEAAILTQASRPVHTRLARRNRLATNTNHIIANEIVDLARRTKRVGVRKLTGIHIGIRAGRKQRPLVLVLLLLLVLVHGWALAQLNSFLLDKAGMAEVRVIEVNPRSSSQQCSQCGHREKANRPSQSKFMGRHCRFVAHAAHNAALHHRIPARATANWPIVARAAAGDLPS